MSSLPTIQAQDYDTQLSINNEKMQQLLVTLFPEMNLPYDAVFQILSYLQETKINSQILPYVIRGIYNISIGTGKGQVIVHIKNNITNVQTRENNDDIETLG
jgi:hypothetical protein